MQLEGVEQAQAGAAQGGAAAAAAVSAGQRPYSAYLSVPTLPGNLYTCTVVSIARLEVCTAKNTKICEFSEVLGKTLHVPVC